LYGGKVVGTLSVYSPEPEYFSEERLKVLNALANVTAIGVHRARLYEEASGMAEELERRVGERTAELRERMAEVEHLNQALTNLLEDLQAAKENLEASSAKLNDLNEELAAKNRELETFTYSVSHDLKAPLRGIDGYSRLLLDDHAHSLNEEGRTFLHTVRRAATQMNQLIDDLLAYSRLERRPMQEGFVDLGALAKALLAERAVEIATRNAQVSVDVTCAGVTCDPDGLALALRNLLENALKFTREASQPAIQIGGRDGPNKCVLWIRDNGVGFDPKFHDRIFEIFQRLHRAEEYPGTGVGLAIVRKAMERMGGRVWAESEPGKGASFFLEIPK